MLPPQLLYFLLHRISVPVFFAFARSGFFSLHFLNFPPAPHLHPFRFPPPKKSVRVLQNSIDHNYDHDHHHDNDHHDHDHDRHHPAPPAPDEHLTK